MLALGLEYSDDAIGSSAHGWFGHGLAAIPVFIAARFSRRLSWVLAPATLIWAVAWTSFAVRRADTLPLGWAVQDLLTPWIPLSVLVVTRFLLPRRFAEGMCRNCGYDLRASPERCPECGMIAAGK